MCEQDNRKKTTLMQNLETKAQKLNKLALKHLKKLKVDTKDSIFKNSYEKDIRVGKLEVIVIMLKLGKDDSDFIKSVTKFDKEEIENIKRAVNMFLVGKDISYIVRYTKLSHEESEIINNQLNRQ